MGSPSPPPPQTSRPSDGEATQQPSDAAQPPSEATPNPGPDAQPAAAERPPGAGEGSVGSPSESESSQESGEASPVDPNSKTATAAPPLPAEAPPQPANDDGWDCHWDAAHQAWFFYNRITHASTWENPRVPDAEPATSSSAAAPGTAEPPKPPSNEPPPAGGYNPAIHGDYDPHAWYAKGTAEEAPGAGKAVDPAAAYAAIGSFNRFTGRWQGDDQNPDQHNDESKSRRQMNAFFDVDAAANSHDGRSLKAERSGKKPSKAELKEFKEKRRAKKEEKRRAWLRD